jgi:AcrR family transcriptional regulator
VGSSTAGRPKTLSPNQLVKKQQIIDAARNVLARDGLVGCTVRAVADAGPLTKSAIHYYFSDMDEVVDAAMASHVDGCLERVRNAADHQEQPLDRFWAAVREYLEIFTGRPNAAPLWFSYWIDAGGKRRLDTVDRMHQQVTVVLRDLLADIPVEGPAARAHALFSYLLGTIVQQAVNPLPFERLRPEIAAVCQLGAPPRAAMDQRQAATKVTETSVPPEAAHSEPDTTR